ncbi:MULTISPECIES: hypothetical protein [Shewanella]|nr:MULTISPECIES: hypothetical protein [Shewanella]
MRRTLSPLVTVPSEKTTFIGGFFIVGSFAFYYETPSNNGLA